MGIPSAKNRPNKNEHVQTWYVMSYSCLKKLG